VKRLTDETNEITNLWGIVKPFLWVAAFIVVVIVVAMTVSTTLNAYNLIIAKDVKVEQMQGSVQTALERRADLIPNYVEIIIGSSKFEHDTLTDVIEMRAQANQIKENVKSARTVEDIQQGQDDADRTIPDASDNATVPGTRSADHSYREPDQFRTEQLQHGGHGLQTDGTDNADGAPRPYLRVFRRSMGDVQSQPGCTERSESILR
jgi:hypothetical protein